MSTASPASTFPANNTQTVAQSLRVSNTQFIGNHAWSFAGGVYIIMHEMPYVYGVTGELVFENCNFLNNTLTLLPSTNRNGGTAVHITNHNVPGYMVHHSSIAISFVGCNFSGNFLNTSNHCSGSGTVFIAMNPAGTHFVNCTLVHNTRSALIAVELCFTEPSAF